MNVTELQAKLLEKKVVMPLPWTEVSTPSFCCKSCVACDLSDVKFEMAYDGAVWFCEQSIDQVKSAWELLQLYVAWDPFRMAREDKDAWGRELQAIFNELGVPVAWDGDAESTMVISVVAGYECAEWVEERFAEDEEDEEEEDEDDNDEW